MGFDIQAAEDLRKADISISSSGDNIIIAAPSTAGNYLAIDFVSLIPTTATSVQFKSGSTNYGGALPLDAKQALTWENAIQVVKGIITCAPNEAFVINLDSSVQVGGIVRYREVGN
jgi:hypothetical protein